MSLSRLYFLLFPHPPRLLLPICQRWASTLAYRSNARQRSNTRPEVGMSERLYLFRLFWAQMTLAALVAISGPKKVSISGPTPYNGPRYGYCLPQKHYVPRHKNNRYINSYFVFRSVVFSSLLSLHLLFWPHSAPFSLYHPYWVHTELGASVPPCLSEISVGGGGWGGGEVNKIS
jgi:hypothetical protein